MLITILFVIVFIISASLCYKFRNHDVSMVLLLLAVCCAVGLIVCGAMCACTPYDSDLRTQDAMDKERMLLELRFTVDHIDHNKRNNRVDNLEWVSQAENLIRAQDDIVVSAVPTINNAGAEPAGRDTGKILEECDNTLAKWLATTTDTTCRSFIVQEGITLDTVFTNTDGFKGTAMEAIDWLQKHNSKVSTTEEKFFFKLCNSIRMDGFMYSRKWNFLRGVK